MAKRVVQKNTLLLAGAGAFFIMAFFLWRPSPEEVSRRLYELKLEQRSQLSKALEEPISQSVFPEDIDAFLPSGRVRGKVTYTFDEKLQNEAAKLLRQYRPDYGAVFMMDASSGKVLAFTSYQKENDVPGNMVTRGTYPAASVFKIVTAATAVDRAGLTAGHTIRFNGGNYTLYRKNVLSDQINRWTRSITLRDAFARSINTAFGRLSLEELDPKDLSEYSTRFMFNQPIPADFPVETGVAMVPDEKGYELTEVASGFNRWTRMSPVQGAMIAGAIINDGTMMMPYMIEKVTDEDGQTVYEGQPLDNGAILSTEAARELRDMMEETILSGTSRKSFRTIVRDRKFKEIEMGGKTGHLTGDNPKGGVDWFVGYAADGDRKIAIGALTVNKKYWTVKSSYLAKVLFRRAFPPRAQREVVSHRESARTKKKASGSRHVSSVQNHHAN